MENKKVTNSVGMFDLHKGMAMICIIFFHVYQQYNFIDFEGEINVILSLFDLIVTPLFSSILVQLFVISGYGFRKRDIRKFAKQQIQFLLKPYIITAIASTVLLVVCHFSAYSSYKGAIKEGIKQMIGFIIGIPVTTEIFGFQIYPCGPIWFMLAFVFGGILFNFLLNYVPDKLQFASCVLLYVIGQLLLPYEAYFPFCIPRCLIVTNGLFAGYWIKKKKIFNNPVSIKEICLLSVCILFLNIKFNPVSMYLIIIIGVIVTHIVLTIDRKLKKSPEIICFIGRYSFYIMCIHTVDMMGILWYLVTEKTNKWPVLAFMGTGFLRLSAITFVCYLIQSQVPQNIFRKIINGVKHE